MKSAAVRPRGSAFTLVETLTVITVISVLAVLITRAVGVVMRKGAETKEISNARQVIAAYLKAAREDDGQLPAGYGNFPANDDQGQPVKIPVNYRYPWRIAPHLGYDMRILWGNNGDDNLRKLAAGPHDEYVYGISVQPALGMNVLFVGGDYQVLDPTKPKVQEKYGSFCVTRLSQASRPESLIVFASAGSGKPGKGHLSGYFKVEAPSTTGRKWDREYVEGNAPESTGWVDFRYGGRAVVANLAGNVEVLNFKELDDMRRWSNQAADADDQFWQLGKTQ